MGEYYLTFISCSQIDLKIVDDFDFFPNQYEFSDSGIFPTSEVIFVEIPDQVSYLWGGWYHMLCVLADLKQNWNV